MTNCGTLQSKFAATGAREVAATAFEAEMRAPGDRQRTTQPIAGSFSQRVQPQSLQHGLRLAESANDFSDGGRLELDESRCHEDAIRQRALRFLQHIYDFDLVSILQVGPAQRSKVGKRLRGVLRATCDIKPELEYGASTHSGFGPIREWA